MKKLFAFPCVFFFPRNRISRYCKNSPFRIVYKKQRSVSIFPADSIELKFEKNDSEIVDTSVVFKKISGSPRLQRE